MNGLESRNVGATSSNKDKAFSIPLGVNASENATDEFVNESNTDTKSSSSPSPPSLFTPPTELPTTNVPIVSKSRLSSVIPSLPKPVEGYEEKIAALNAGAAIPPEPIMMEGRKRYQETEVITTFDVLIALLFSFLFTLMNIHWNNVITPVGVGEGWRERKSIDWTFL